MPAPGRVQDGLSPRGRGKPRDARIPARPRGSIPAWAGETWWFTGTARPTRVYPRVGGGNINREYSGGSALGLSPRGRGKQPWNADRHRRGGSIPAWAGETPIPTPAPAPSPVYPRVGGGNAGGAGAGFAIDGLSPRGRGKPALLRPIAGRDGSIPAWAGETGPPAPNSRAGWVYPRVGGGNIGRKCPPRRGRGLSPRGRGKPAQRPYQDQRVGSIPAWAGETPA